MTIKEKIDRYLERFVIILIFMVFLIILFVMATKTPEIGQHNHNRIFPNTNINKKSSQP